MPIDFLGDARPTLGGYDIGAMEYLSDDEVFRDGLEAAP
jgi:hypothetical protein